MRFFSRGDDGIGFVGGLGVVSLFVLLFWVFFFFFVPSPLLLPLHVSCENNVFSTASLALRRQQQMVSHNCG